MKIIDSHCHLQSIDFDKIDTTEDDFIKSCFDSEDGLGDLLCVCIEIDDFPNLIRIADKHPKIRISFGQHPNDTETVTIKEFEAACDQYILHEKIIAIGETGLDYYRDGDIDAQQLMFRRQIQLAKEHNKPLIIHTRNAVDDTLRILKEERAHEVGGIFHCFTESWEMAKAGIDLGFYISFSGIITFKNAQAIRDVVEKVPLDRLLIETDAPYLAPVPHRGKVNLPLYVNFVGQEVAKIKNTDLETIIKTTSSNFYQLFPRS